MEITKLTRNTISISYNLDKTAQVGYFVLSLFKDNQPVFVKDIPSVTYYRKGTAEIKTWSPTVKDGFVYLNANDFADIHKAGTYYITCILANGDIYPSQGSAILTLEGDLPEASEVQIQPITGANGKDGASITGIKLDKTQTHFIFTLSDGQTIETSVSMPDVVKGDKGDKGQDGLSAYQIALKNGFKGTEQEWLQSLKGPKGDSITGPRGEKGEKGDSIVGPKGQDGQPGKSAPHVTRVTYNDDQLTFSFSDGSSLSTPFIMPVPKNGIDGKDGKNGTNAPMITNVNYANNELTFTFSDGSKKSTSFIMPTPTNGKDGKDGTNAPVVTSVNYANDLLTFNFSDGTNKSTSFIMPTPKDGKDGKPGKDAPTITNVDLNDDQTQLIFTFSDGKKIQTEFKAPEAIAGPKGQDGKDAPHVSRVTYNDDNLTFSFSDGSSLSTPFIMPVPENGKDGKNGQDAPTIVSVNYANDKLTFNFSDETSKSTSFIMPVPTNGKDGVDGKNAPTITNVSYANNELTFRFSDGTSKSTSFIMPVPTNGKDGVDGKNAPTITNVSYDNNELTFSFSDGTSKSTSFIMPTPENGKDGKNGQDAPTVTNVSYANDQLTFTFSDGTSKSTPLVLPDPTDNVKDGPDNMTIIPPELTSNLVIYSTSSYQYVNSVDNITKNNPFLKVKYDTVRLKYKKGNKDTYSYPNFIISFKPIFDELDTKANKTDVPTTDSIASQIDQNLKEKLKKNIITKITPPGYLDDTGSRVQSGLSISSYNLNGDSDTMRYTPNQIVALDNADSGYTYDIPILKLNVNEQYGMVSMLLQGSLTGNSRPKKFSIGKTDISYPDPSSATIILSTDNQQGSSYSSNVIQIRDQSDNFSGLPVTVVNANIRESTPEAREAFKNAFSDFNEKFYFLHIEG